MKTGPKLNLIKKIWGKRGWGWGGEGYPTTLIVSSLVCEFDKEAKSDKKKFGGGGGGRGVGRALKPKQQTVSNEVNTKMQLSTQCRACGTINISKYVNIFLSTNPTTFILSSLVSEFCQRI